MIDLTGRTAFITGGANGIGLGIAKALAAEGVKLALADIDDAALAEAKASLAGETSVETYRLNVTDRAAFAGVADAAEEALGNVSLLFNNAGVAGGGPATKLSYDVWDWGVGINLGGVFNGVRTFLPRMVRHGGGGHIVNTASAAGLAGMPSGLLYTTTKFAVVGMSESLRLELDPLGIGVSVLCPGPVATDIHRRSGNAIPANPELTETERQAGSSRIAEMRALLQRGATPDEVGATVVDAIRRNRLFIATDRIALPVIEARHAALIDAMQQTSGRAPPADFMMAMKNASAVPDNDAGSR